MRPPDGITTSWPPRRTESPTNSNTWSEIHSGSVKISYSPSHLRLGPNYPDFGEDLVFPPYCLGFNGDGRKQLLKRLGDLLWSGIK